MKFLMLVQFNINCLCPKIKLHVVFWILCYEGTDPYKNTTQIVQSLVKFQFEFILEIQHRISALEIILHSYKIIIKGRKSIHMHTYTYSLTYTNTHLPYSTKKPRDYPAPEILLYSLNQTFRLFSFKLKSNTYEIKVTKYYRVPSSPCPSLPFFNILTYIFWNFFYIMGWFCTYDM